LRGLFVNNTTFSWDIISIKKSGLHLDIKQNYYDVYLTQKSISNDLCVWITYDIGTNKSFIFLQSYHEDLYEIEYVKIEFTTINIINENNAIPDFDVSCEYNYYKNIVTDMSYNEGEYSTRISVELIYNNSSPFLEYGTKIQLFSINKFVKITNVSDVIIVNRQKMFQPSYIGPPLETYDPENKYKLYVGQKYKFDFSYQNKEYRYNNILVENGIIDLTGYGDFTTTIDFTNDGVIMLAFTFETFNPIQIPDVEENQIDEINTFELHVKIGWNFIGFHTKCDIKDINKVIKDNSVFYYNSNNTYTRVTLNEDSYSELPNKSFWIFCMSKSVISIRLHNYNRHNEKIHWEIEDNWNSLGTLYQCNISNDSISSEHKIYISESSLKVYDSNTKKLISTSILEENIGFFVNTGTRGTMIRDPITKELYIKI